MAYENLTYEVILQRMIDRISEKYPTLDIREGSIVFNACSEAAIELAIAYWELDNVNNETHITTASREFKLIACQDIGIDVTQFEATYGLFKGVFDVEVPIGSRWNLDLFNFTVEEYLGMENSYYTYSMRCETYGTSANNIVGSLTAITDMPNNLTYAELTECLIEGENESSDEYIEEVYYNSVNNSETDGNRDQYKKWCNEYPGIGNSKVFPLWNGSNTVKVSILSASNHSASDELINEFQEYLDPNTTGMGDGIAPIGAFVTVTTATEVPLNISATITMKSGYSDTTLIDEAIAEYLSSIAYEKTIVAYMSIGSVILNVEGVENVDAVLINDGTSNITLGDEEIPILGTTNWTVV